jgi:hypothetical protein
VPLPSQSVFPGVLQREFEWQLREFIRERRVQRLWQGDSTLWPRGLTEYSPALRKLDWVSLPKYLPNFLGMVAKIIEDADAEGLLDHALLALESVNLSVRAALEFCQNSCTRKITVFDSTSPDLLRRNEQQLNFARTLFVLANKTHYWLRDQCLSLYLRDKLERLVGVKATRQFVSETEPDSYLAMMSRSYTFREIQSDTSAVPAPFCSLTQFAAFLLASGFAKPEQILRAVEEIQAACSDTETLEANPALQLAAFLTTLMAGRRAYLLLLASPSLVAYSRRLGQMIGGSLAKASPGIVPVTAALPDVTGYANEVGVVALTAATETHEQVNQCVARLRADGTPIVHVKLQDSFSLLTESFKWEAATILASSRVGLDPFEMADNRLPRLFCRELLDELSRGHNLLQRSARIADRLIQLYADGVARQEISLLSLADGLRSFFRIATPAKHISLIVGIPSWDTVSRKFNELRALLSHALKRPVLMMFGPHNREYSTYFFRDSLPSGLCILFTADPLVDQAIPGAWYTFGQLHQALSLSEYDTLVHCDRPVIRLHLSHELPAALEQLLQVFTQALHRFTR